MALSIEQKTVLWDALMSGFRKEATGCKADALLELIQQHRGGILFTDIQDLPGAKGDHTLEASPNTILWTGLSRFMVAAIIRLRDERRIRYVPVHPMLYAAAGAMPDLPIATSPAAIRRGHREPTWLPCSIEGPGSVQ